MNLTAPSGNTVKALFVLLLLVLAAVFAKTFIIPLAIAVIIATLFLPVCGWLQGKKIPNGIACFICLLSILMVMGAVGGLITWQLNDLADNFEKMEREVMKMIDNAQQFIFSKFDIPVEEQKKMMKSEQSSMAAYVAGFATSLMGMGVDFVLVLVYVFLLLFYREHIKQFILKLFTPQKRTEAKDIVFNAAAVSHLYLWGLAKMIMMLWVMYGIGFSIVGVEHAIFFAVLCGLLEIVPFVGNITGTGITVLAGIAQGGDGGMVVGIIVVYGVVQFIQTYVLEPLVVGSEVNLNPLFTIIALVLGELVWGIPGMVLAIPLTGMLKIVCDHVDALKPYGFLLGEPKKEKHKWAFIEKMKLWLKRKWPLRKKVA